MTAEVLQTEQPNPPLDPNRPIAGIAFLLLADHSVVTHQLNEREAHRNLTAIEIRGILDWMRANLDAQATAEQMQRAARGALVVPGR